MADRFRDRVVLITGAASGFGAAVARAFATEGAHLALSDISEGVLALGAELGCLAEIRDVTCEADHAAHVSAILARHGRLDIALNNAGIAERLEPLTSIAGSDWDRVMAVNAKGVFLGMKHQIPPMIAARSGVILNTASAAGLVGAGQMAAYAASKHAVVGLTRAAADEVARHGVRVNAICPSFAETPLYSGIAEDLGSRTGEDRAAADRRMSARIPMRRVARVEEVVQAMLFAVDPANSFMTGQALAIDGGLTAV